MVGCFEHGNELWGSIKSGYFLTSLGTIRLWKRSLLHGITSWL